KALDLVRVQVHGHDVVDADGGQHVRDDLGGNGHACRARPAILARIAEIGYRGGDTTGRSALERVDHDQNFHQIVVGRGAGRLQDEHIPSPHVFEQLDHHFAVGETADEIG